ncbi:methyltransferase domain-containing protein [Thermodesulfobacteriota bacterium]
MRNSKYSSPRPDELVEHYASGYEASRLQTGHGKIDCARSRELLERFLPPQPATVLDIGGGPGGHACWLAGLGYEVHLIDIVPLHVEQAREASAQQPSATLASAEVGDASALSWANNSVDAILLFGPLYHLTDKEDRLRALAEAYRVLKPAGVILAVGISRFASTFDGLRAGFIKDPAFVDIVNRDLRDGCHQNPTRKPEYFMDTFFHHPEELRSEVAEAGFLVGDVYGVEGPSWLVPDLDDWWRNENQREELLRIARELETEPTLLGVSAHLMAVATKG